MASFTSPTASKFRYVFVACFTLYLVLVILVLALGARVHPPSSIEGSPNAKLFTLAKIFRVLGFLPALVLGSYVVAALLLRKWGRGFLFIFLLGIPATLFQGIGAILDASCSSSYGKSVSAPKSLLGAAAFGIFSAFASVAAAVFLGINRRSMAGLCDGNAQLSSGPAGAFEPYYEEGGLDLDEDFPPESQEHSSQPLDD